MEKNDTHVPTFRCLLLCFCIVFAEHLRSLNEMRTQYSWGSWNESHLSVLTGSSTLKCKREWYWCDIFISEHKVLQAAGAFLSTLGMTNIQLLFIKVRGPGARLPRPCLSLRDYRGALELIAQIIKFNIYPNKYNQPAVWQGTQFIKSPCLFVVSLIKI